MPWLRRCASDLGADRGPLARSHGGRPGGAGGEEARRRLGLDAVLVPLHQVDELADRDTLLHGVTQLLVTTDEVVVAAADPHPGDDAGPLEVTDDLLHGPLGDADARGDVTHQYFRVCGQTHQHVPVVADERPTVPRHTYDDRGIGIREWGVRSPWTPQIGGDIHHLPRPSGWAIREALRPYVRGW